VNAHYTLEYLDILVVSLRLLETYPTERISSYLKIATANNENKEKRRKEVETRLAKEN